MEDSVRNSLMWGIYMLGNFTHLLLYTIDVKQVSCNAYFACKME
ncbi:hypothetical protein SLEP1_g11232 [Rubroshorea leprosula]|uniref:Uncharacterized protein n=1 Tax=Rubroshorea leprosula TaxID=152421 RepID=A0AAV5IM22_9ROSI|nr:hypothetical protein SLEP1_g11232 [Rubroshorea leprosula]